MGVWCIHSYFFENQQSKSQLQKDATKKTQAWCSEELSSHFLGLWVFVALKKDFIQDTYAAVQENR